MVAFSDRFSASSSLTLDCSASVAAFRFSRYLCAAARLAARVRSTCVEYFECEHIAEDFRLPLRDAGAAWKFLRPLSLFSLPSIEDVLLVDRGEDQVEEHDRSGATVLGLDLSNVPLSVIVSSALTPPGLPWRWTSNAERGAGADGLCSFPNHEASTSPISPDPVDCLPASTTARSIEVPLLNGSRDCSGLNVSEWMLLVYVGGMRAGDCASEHASEIGLGTSMEFSALP